MHLHRYSEHQFHQHHSHQHQNHDHVYHLVAIVMIIIITIMIIIMIVMNAIIIIITIIIIIIQLSVSEQQPCRYTGLCSNHQQWSVFCFQVRSMRWFSDMDIAGTSSCHVHGQMRWTYVSNGIQMVPQVRFKNSMRTSPLESLDTLR